jgi:hypothetical protein
MGRNILRKSGFQLARMITLLYLGNCATVCASGFAGTKIDHHSVTGDGVGVAVNQGSIDARHEHQQHGGQANHIFVNSSPAHEREKKPHEYFAQGEIYINKKPPNWEEALEAFRYAADIDPPHLFACLRCAEYFHKKTNKPDVKMATHYYNRALSAKDKNPALIYGGLMKLYYEVGINAKNERMKKDYLEKSINYSKQITTLDDDDYTIIDDLETKLAVFGVGTSSASAGVITHVVPGAIVRGEEVARQTPLTVARPISTVPEIARGYEEVYRRFINGKLIFDNNEGQRKEFSFSQFATTLDGEFDLRGLTYKYDGNTYNVSDYLRIKVGYRTTQENDDKVTCWFTPRFLLENSNSRWKSLDWKSPLGIFWSYGNWGLEDFDYLTKSQFDEISSKNLSDCVDDGGLPMVAAASLGAGWWGTRVEKFYPKF